MSQSVRGILFDLGDTLLDFGDVDVNREFEEGTRLAYDYLRKLGHPLPPFGRYHRTQLWAVRWYYFLSHLRGRDFNSLDLIGGLSNRMGHDLTHEQLIDLASLWYEPVRRRATMEPGTLDMLEQFTQQGVKLGLLSNTFIPSEVLDRHLQQVGLLEFLPVRIYSCLSEYRKPHPSIFAEAATAIDLPAESLLFVGDSLKADVAGANRAGMISVLKDPTGRRKHWRITPRHRICRLTDLPSVLGQYMS
ncbi:hypothetical protein LCGC14_0269170 [marine sediment metagenome]|uniref:HAD family hydrolase n=1 Tax=marine sediment metagenome TaxID=412755 RepID=A0A0F9X4C8_9ZZZZ|nr:HAD family hydrolase [Phycisphaerae bacterium]HDZ44229.1 HAD family hydrolase [Phycisphaerae bacterium]